MEIRFFLSKLAKTKLSCGKNLIELTTYNDVVLWGFAEFDFRRFINRLLNADSDCKVSGSKLILVFFYKMIDFFLDILTVTLIKLIIKIYEKNNRVKENKVQKILITAHDIVWGRIKDYENSNIRKSDVFFDSIFKKLKDRYMLIGTYPLSFLSSRGLKIFIDKLKNWDIPHRPVNLYWSLSVWKKEKEASKYFKEVWKILRNDKIFRGLCIYNGKDLYNLMETTIKYYFYRTLPRALKHIEIAKRMIEKENPDLILVQNEYGDFEQSLVIASKLKRVPTLAVQHGVIIPTNRGYLFNKEEKGKRILPDITCVYSQYYHNLLINTSIYEPEQVVVTGQPRYDILHHVDKIYAKEKILKRYKINPNHKIILWTTQSHSLEISKEENINNLKVVFDTMQNLENTTLIIKQHPGERETHTKMIEKYLNDYKINALLIPKRSDTYEQIFVSDLMITQYSTTAMEAVVMNKPVIILNMSGKPDPVEYVKEGVALGVYKEEDLKQAIEKLLKDDIELAENRKRYIEKYLYKIDGKATERVVNLITMMMEERKE